MIFKQEKYSKTIGLGVMVNCYPINCLYRPSLTITTTKYFNFHAPLDNIQSEYTKASLTIEELMERTYLIIEVHRAIIPKPNNDNNSYKRV